MLIKLKGARTGQTAAQQRFYNTVARAASTWLSGQPMTGMPIHAGRVFARLALRARLLGLIEGTETMR
jgi:hypothetical protein